MFFAPNLVKGELMLKNFGLERIERWIIILIALHSFGFGIALLWAPSWGLKFAGWENVQPLFFTHQGGAFHIVLAIGYLIEHYRYRGILLLLTAKTIATIFLLGSWAMGESAWVVPFSGVADGLMGLVAFLIHRQVVKSLYKQS